MCEPRRDCCRPQLLRDGSAKSKTTNKFALEVCEQAVRMALERDNLALRQANEIPRKASGSFAPAKRA